MNIKVYFSTTVLQFGSLGLTLIAINIIILLIVCFFFCADYQILMASIYQLDHISPAADPIITFSKKQQNRTNNKYKNNQNTRTIQFNTLVNYEPHSFHPVILLFVKLASQFNLTDIIS